MKQLRTSIREHRRWAIALIVLAFCIKAIVPAGFMISQSSDTVLTISVCSESTGTVKAMKVVVPSRDGGAKHAEEAKGSHCAFSGLAKVSTGAVDAVLLFIAFAVILVLGLAPVRAAPYRRIPHFMPPLRGPPAAA